MQKFRKLILAILSMTLLMSSVHGQENIYQEALPEAMITCESTPAYCEGIQAAHWSVYVPIGALIVAAVWLGFADKQHGDCYSSYSSYCYDNSSSSGSSSSSSYSYRRCSSTNYSKSSDSNCYCTNRYSSSSCSH